MTSSSVSVSLSLVAIRVKKQVKSTAEVKITLKVLVTAQELEVLSLFHLYCLKPKISVFKLVFRSDIRIELQAPVVTAKSKAKVVYFCCHLKCLSSFFTNREDTEQTAPFTLFDLSNYESKQYGPRSDCFYP